MEAKLLRIGFHNFLCYSKILLLVFFPTVAIGQARFNTVIYESDNPHERSTVNRFNVELETYHLVDSLKQVKNPIDMPGDTIQISTDGSMLQKLRQTASAQVLYYESLIDSLMFENFKLKMDLAVIKRRINDFPISKDYNENLSSGIRGKYNPNDDLTIESLIAEIQKNGIKHPKIVLAQAILETGWFKSRVCHTHNNLFGLRQPWDGEYFRFERWQDSVKAYRTKVQYKYRGGPYLQWLKDLGYAEDPNYTDKLKILLYGPLKTY